MNPNKANILGSVALGVLLLTSTGAYAYDADTLAFYPFCDGAVGENGTALTLTNAVDASKFLATSYTDSAWAGAGLFFTNDVPGRYLVGGKGFHEEGPVASIFQAATLNARRNDATGVVMSGYGTKVTCSGLASELSKCESWTVECFAKIPRAVDCTADYKRLITLDAGIKNGTNEGDLHVVAVSETVDGKGWRVQLGNGYPVIGNGADGYGEWLHVALVCTATELKYFVNYAQVGSTVSITRTGENEGKDLEISGNRKWCGHIAGLRVMKRALTTDEMLRVSEYPTGDPMVLAQWPLEGVIGTQPTGERMTAVDIPAGNVPLLEERRNGRVYEQGVQMRETLAAVRLSGVEKAAGATYATGNALMIPENSFVPILGDFTMEGFFKFDRKVWETKYYTDKNEIRPYVGLFRQDWRDGDKTRKVWQISLQRYGDGTYHPRVGANRSDWAAMTDTGFGSAVKTDGKWHHYAVTYDHAQMTFEFFEDGVSLGTHTFSDPIGLDKQPAGGNTAYYVGAATGAHPFEGLVDEVRLSQKKLTPAEFVSIDDRQGMMLIVR